MVNDDRLEKIETASIADFLGNFLSPDRALPPHGVPCSVTRLCSFYHVCRRVHEDKSELENGYRRLENLFNVRYSGKKEAAPDCCSKQQNGNLHSESFWYEYRCHHAEGFFPGVHIPFSYKGALVRKEAFDNRFRLLCVCCYSDNTSQDPVHRAHTSLPRISSPYRTDFETCPHSAARSA